MVSARAGMKLRGVAVASYEYGVWRGCSRLYSVSGRLTSVLLMLWARRQLKRRREASNNIGTGRDESAIGLRLRLIVGGTASASVSVKNDSMESVSGRLHRQDSVGGMSVSLAE